MSKLRFSLSLAVVVVVVFSSCAAHVWAAPGWAMAAAHRPTPADVGDAPAVVLFSEATTRISADGDATRTLRFALRVLTSDGRSRARAAVPYLARASHVRTTDAWLIRDGREVKSSSRRDWVDAAAEAFGALYSDSRVRAVTFAPEAVAGDVFAVETEVSTPLVFAEDYYAGGSEDLPVASETYQLELPAGFAATWRVRGEPAPTRTDSKDGRTITWTLPSQPFLPMEPAAPPYATFHPMLLARIQPPAGNNRFKPLVIHEWRDLSRWSYALNEPQCDRDPHLSALASRLTGGAPDTLTKIRALAAYVQGLHYAALLEGLAKGLGYQPHKATQILAQGYGDCKDKANLLRALLREIGVDSYLVAARASDDLPVQEDFPFGAQFDHAIVAIRVDAGTELPSIVETPAGRMLFFDPTAEHTVLGDLPLPLQGSFVFIQDPDCNSLVRLPRFEGVERIGAVRRATLKLQANTACSGHISLTGNGQAGAALRSLMFSASNDEALGRLARRQLGPSARTAHLQSLDRRDDLVTGTSTLNFELEKSPFLQPLRNALFVLRAEIFSNETVPALTARTRRMPVKLSPATMDDRIEFQLPPELIAEELPAPVKLDSPYGRYKRVFSLEGDKIVSIRQLELKPQTVPVAEYAAVSKFLSAIGRSDHASIILRQVEPAGATNP